MTGERQIKTKLGGRKVVKGRKLPGRLAEIFIIRESSPGPTIFKGRKTLARYYTGNIYGIEE